VNGLKNLIMGACVGRPFRHLEPFIASLRRTSFAGDVCIFVEDVTTDAVEQLRAYGIIVERTAPTAVAAMTAMSSCYFSYLDFLVRHDGEYTGVMLTDPFSVIFQSDPFAEPLPADIIYTVERCRLGESNTAYDAVVQAYGEAVANNLRDFMAANTSATIGTNAGMLRYLLAMTHQLSGRTTPVTGAMHVGIHNYVVRMRPLRRAWPDQSERIAVAMHTVPDEAVQISGDRVLIDSKAVPVICHWLENQNCQEHFTDSPRYRLDDSMRGEWPSAPSGHSVSSSAMSSGSDAVIAFYQRERDTSWLPLFLGSLRCVTTSLAVHCIGNFEEADQAILTRYNCIGHQISIAGTDRADNLAHFYLSEVLDRLAADRSRMPDQVLMLDSVRAIFARDPFQAKTSGLSVFCEGSTRISDSDFNRDRLAFFVPPEQARLSLPIVSSSLLRGPLPLVREFYRRLFIEFVGRSELLGVHKVVQGAFNKLCQARDPKFPVVIHPNAAEAYFDFWPSGLSVDTRHGVRIGGTVPGLVLGGHPETELMMKLRLDLGVSGG
jgi:hypothetical protein